MRRHRPAESPIHFTGQKKKKPKGPLSMLMIFAVVLLVLWLIGLVTGSTFGGLVHILLVVALIVVAWRIHQTRLIR